MPLAITVHHAKQAHAILDAARARGLDVQLISPSRAVRVLGVGFFHQLSVHLAIPILIDCGDHVGDALAAIQLGTPRIRADCRPDFQSKLASMANKADLRLIRDLPIDRVILKSGDEFDEILARLG